MLLSIMGAMLAGSAVMLNPLDGDEDTDNAQGTQETGLNGGDLLDDEPATPTSPDTGVPGTSIADFATEDDTTQVMPNLTQPSIEDTATDDPSEEDEGEELPLRGLAKFLRWTADDVDITVEPDVTEPLDGGTSDLPPEDQDPGDVEVLVQPETSELGARPLPDSAEAMDGDGLENCDGVEVTVLPDGDTSDEPYVKQPLVQDTDVPLEDAATGNDLDPDAEDQGLSPVEDDPTAPLPDPGEDLPGLAPLDDSLPSDALLDPGSDEGSLGPTLDPPTVIPDGPVGPTLPGAPVTISGGNDDDMLTGGSGDDVLSGSNGDDVLLGEGGNDSLSGDNGIDTLLGGDGDDELDGGRGDDQLDGGAGDDGLIGGYGNDTLVGGEGDDNILGGAQDDVLSGGEGRDTLDGGEGNDALYGWLSGTTDSAEDADILTGGDGNDTLVLGAGDTGTGGEGNDHFFVGGWSAGQEPVQITDFDSNDDEITVFWEEDGQDFPPSVSVLPDLNQDGFSSIFVNGQLVAEVQGVPDLDRSDIKVVELGTDEALDLLPDISDVTIDIPNLDGTGGTDPDPGSVTGVLI